MPEITATDAARHFAELLDGVEHRGQHYTIVRRGKAVAQLGTIIESLPILAYDRRVAVEHAELLAVVRRQGRPRDAHDLLIAATARATHRTIVTADQGVFADLPGVSTIGHR